MPCCMLGPGQSYEGGGIAVAQVLFVGEIRLARHTSVSDRLVTGRISP